jgi:hypothetical protein
MALACTVFATVMTPDTKNVPMTGIFGRVELEAIKGQTGPQAVDTVIAVNPNGGDIETVWTRSGSPKMAARDFNITARDLEVRDDKGQNGCLTPEQVAWWEQYLTF